MANGGHLAAEAVVGGVGQFEHFGGDGLVRFQKGYQIEHFGVRVAEKLPHLENDLRHGGQFLELTQHLAAEIAVQGRIAGGEGIVGGRFCQLPGLDFGLLPQDVQIQGDARFALQAGKSDLFLRR